MSKIVQSKQIYEFGQFCLNASERLLINEGKPVTLPPKVFDTLLLLVEKSGHIVSKDELIEKLWPDSFVEEGSLTTYISQLRKLLGDSTNEPRYIETVPKHGYRFIAQVSEINNSFEEHYETTTVLNHLETTETTLPAISNIENSQVLSGRIETERKRENFKHLRMVYLLIMVIGAFSIYFLSIKLSRPVPFQKMEINRLTTNGRIGQAAISTDGRYIVYAQQEGAKATIWLRQTDSGSGLQLLELKTVRIAGLSFTPDNSRICYVTYEKSNIGSLYEIQTLGGTPRKILEDIDSPVTFSPDGKQFAFVRMDPVNQKNAIIIYNLDSSSEKRLADFRKPDQVNPLGLSWSPDGKVLAATIGGLAFGTPSVRVVAIDLKTSGVSPIGSEKWNWVEQMAWLKDGSGIVMPAWRQDSPIYTDQIWYLSYPNGKVSKVTNDINRYHNMSLGGESLLTIQTIPYSRLWISSTEMMNKDEKEINFGFGDIYSESLGISWLSDDRIVYGSNAGASSDIWIMKADGTDRKQLTADPAADIFPSVSGDNRYIAFCSYRKGIPHIWRMDIDGQNLKQLTDGKGELTPDISPDGKWVVYTATDQDRTTLRKVSIEGGESIELTNYDSFRPVVSPDGNMVAFHMMNKQSKQMNAAIIPLTGGSPIRTFELPALTGGELRWSTDSSALIYSVTENGVSNLWSQPIEGGSAKQITEYNADKIFRFTFSKDGKHLACERGVIVNDLVLIKDQK